MISALQLFKNFPCINIFLGGVFVKFPDFKPLALTAVRLNSTDFGLFYLQNTEDQSFYLGAYFCLKYCMADTTSSSYSKGERSPYDHYGASVS
jgi:hypothetical protein